MATAGKILMFPVGNWTSGNNYGFLDIVYYGGSSYIAKTDITNSTINPVTDTTNWQILAHGYIADTLSGIEGIDTSGLLGTAGATVVSQTLMDKIADMVADKLVLKTAISNQQINDTSKVTGSALSYSIGQSITNLSTALDTTNINLALKANSDDSGFNQTEHRIGYYKGKALYAKTVYVSQSVNATWQSIYTVSGATLVLIDYGKSYIIDSNLVMPLESKDGSGVISRCTGASVQCYCFSNKTYEFALSVMYTKD